MRRFILTTSLCSILLTLSTSLVAQPRAGKGPVSWWKNRGLKRIEKVISLGVGHLGAVSAAHVVNTLRRLVAEKKIAPNRTVVVPESRLTDPVTDSGKVAANIAGVAQYWSREMNKQVASNRVSPKKPFGGVFTPGEQSGHPEMEMFVHTINRYLTEELKAGIAYLEIPRSNEAYGHFLEAAELSSQKHNELKLEYGFDRVQELGNRYHKTQSFAPLVERYHTKYRTLADVLAPHRDQWVAENLGHLMTRRTLRKFGLRDLLSKKEPITVVRMYGYGHMDALDLFFKEHSIPHEKIFVPGDSSHLEHRLHHVFDPVLKGKFIPSKESVVSSASVEQLIAFDLLRNVTVSHWEKLSQLSPKYLGRFQANMEMGFNYLLQKLDSERGLDLKTIVELPYQALSDVRDLNAYFQNETGNSVPFKRFRAMAALRLRDSLLAMVPSKVLVTVGEKTKNAQELFNEHHSDTWKMLAPMAIELDVKRAEHILSAGLRPAE